MPITPTPGTDAVAAGMPLVPGTALASDLEEYINQTRDFIAQRTNAVTPITKGGTGAATAPAARTALGITAANVPTTGADVQTDLNYLATIKANTATTYDRTTVDAAFAARDSSIAGRVAKSGDTMSGDLLIPGAFAAVSGFTVCYVNSDGRISRGSSALKYKKFVSDVDPESLGDIFPQLVRYQMRSLDGTGDGDWKLGHIADWLAEHPDLARFVVRLNGEIESIDFIQLLLAQTAVLHAQVDMLAQRVETLENAS